MLKREEIKKIFGADEDHFALINYVINNGGEILYAEKYGVLALYKGIYALFGTSGQGLEKALSLVENASCFVCSSSEEGDAVLEKFKNIKKKKACYQILYREPFGVQIPADTIVKELPPTDENIDFVKATYTLGFSREDIKRLMQDFTFYATYTNGELSGYIGRHDEGSIGLLEIMPKFRRKGLGAFLVDYSVKKVNEQGDIAYCNIEVSNEKSLKMHLKMNFIPSNKFVYWCN